MNYVNVRFLGGNNPKLYIYKNRCELYEGDYAMVEVLGHKTLVRVERVYNDNPSCFDHTQLKWIKGAVFLDEIQIKLEQAKARIEKMRKEAEARLKQERLVAQFNERESKEFTRLNNFIAKYNE
jgi:hypothetical protein